MTEYVRFTHTIGPDGRPRLRRTNGELMRDCAALGYLGNPSTRVIDLTYGHGKFWTMVRPLHFTGCDLNPDKSPIGRSVDCANTGFLPIYGTVVLDVPYKLNGTTTAALEESDERYGVNSWQSAAVRRDTLSAGIVEGWRLLHPGGFLLVKLQDQVNGGKRRLLTRQSELLVESMGGESWDALAVSSYRKQPDRADRAGNHDPYPTDPPQQHSHMDISVLEVFRKPPARRRKKTP